MSNAFIYKLRIISIEIKEIENIADNQGNGNMILGQMFETLKKEDKEKSQKWMTMNENIELMFKTERG